MDLEPNETQRQILSVVDRILVRGAGPARARHVLHEGDGHDAELAAALAAGGFSAAFDEPDAGPLALALVVEAVSRRLGCVALTGPLLVGPGALGRTDLDGLTLLDGGRPGPVRGARPGPALIVEGDDARLVSLEERHLERVASPYGYPLHRIAEPPGGGDLLPGRAASVRAWWRVGVALEAAGAMRGAMELAVGYVKERQQFGQPIGALQSIQHRLAWATTVVEGARWLALEAAWSGAPEDRAATAAGAAAGAAQQVLRDAHQVHGAIGFTVEEDLHLWTLRLQVLRLELGGRDEHRRAAGAAWLRAQAPT